MKLEIKNLKKLFRTDTVETAALNNVSFTVNDGDFVAVMGPSGCGKSTLLNILGLLDNPTAGSYRIDGLEVAGLRESERTSFRKGRIGFVFQSFNLIDDMNVRDNIMLPLNNLSLSKDAQYGHITPRPPLSLAAVGRPAAACCHSACHSVAAGADSCRRTYR